MPARKGSALTPARPPARKRVEGDPPGKPAEPVPPAKRIEPVQAPKRIEPVQAPKRIEPVQAPKRVDPAPPPKPAEPVPPPKAVEPVQPPKQIEPAPPPKQIEPAPPPKRIEPAPPPKQIEPAPPPKRIEPAPPPKAAEPAAPGKRIESAPVPKAVEPPSAPRAPPEPLPVAAVRPRQSLPAQRPPSRPSSSLPFKPRKAAQAPVHVDATLLPERVNFNLEGLPELDIAPFPVAEGGGEIRVSPGPGCLAQAIESAAAGSTILVPGGRYHESIEVTKPLNFVADGDVSIYGAGLDTVTVTAVGVSFTGFTIKQKLSRARCAIGVNSGTLVLTNCKVSSIALACILLRGDIGLRLVGCLITATGQVPGVNTQGASQVVAENCLFGSSKSSHVVLKSASVGKFVRCHFNEAVKGGVLSSENSHIFIDSCQFQACSIEITNSSSENVIGGSFVEKKGGTGILCGGRSRTFLRKNTIAGSCIDTCDNAKVETVGNDFRGGSFVLSGTSQGVSDRDTFKGQTPAAVGVSADADLVLKNLVMEDISGSGVVCYEESKVTIEHARISKCEKSGVMVHSCGRIVATDLVVVGCGEVGLVLQDTKETNFRGLKLIDNKKLGGEVSRARQCSFVDVQVKGNEKCGLIFIETQAELEGCGFIDNQFAGLHVGKGSKVKLGEAQFVGNQRGGLLILEKSSVRVSNSSFTRNDWSAVSCDADSSVTLDDCQFEGNRIGVTAVGDVRIKNGQFATHTEVAVVVAGQFDGERLSFARQARVALAVRAGGNFGGRDLTFEGNTTHIQATGGALAIEGGVFRQSSGEAGVHIKNAVASFSKCEFVQDSQLAICAEGEVNINQSKIGRAGRAGIIFGPGAKGTVQGSEFFENGECAVQCIGGTPTIRDNLIRDHQQFGIYIFRPAMPIVADNRYQNNGMAEIWHERFNNK